VIWNAVCPLIGINTLCHENCFFHFFLTLWDKN
jgi:hypothetical protein